MEASERLPDAIDTVPSRGGQESSTGSDVDEKQTPGEKEATLARVDPVKLDEATAYVTDFADPFPEDPTAPYEDQELTFRALVVGGLLGGLVNASNLYLSLRTGFTFSAGIFGALGGYGIIKLIVKYLPNLGPSVPTPTPFAPVDKSFNASLRRFF